MIKREELVKIGKINKTHGIGGEVSVMFAEDVFDIDSSPYLVCDIDGIFVPFFIEDYRFRSDVAALVKFEDIDSEDSARILINREVYFPKKYISEEDVESGPADYFLGYKVFVSGRELGEITEIDDSTVNVLFTVTSPDGKEYLIPATADFVESIDENRKVIVMNVPEGLLDI